MNLANINLFFEPQTDWGRLLFLAENFGLRSGGSFELIRPFFLFVAVLLSALVLASARKRDLPWPTIILWTTGVLFVPQVFLPLYCAFLFWRGPRPKIKPPYRFALPWLFLLLGWGGLGWSFYRAYHTLDAQLARANQFRTFNWPNQSIYELRAALLREENPHTRNLLGQVLADAGRHEEAVKEFRVAAQNSEPDDLLPLRLAHSLDVENHTAEAAPEYRRFLQTAYCATATSDKCEAAALRLKALENSL